MLRHSKHIAESVKKKKRIPEGDIVKLTTSLIQKLQRENEGLGGGRKTPHGVKKCYKNKAPNSFIKFSSSLRPIFVEALKTAQAKATGDVSRGSSWFVHSTCKVNWTTVLAACGGCMCLLCYCMKHAWEEDIILHALNSLYLIVPNGISALFNDKTYFWHARRTAIAQRLQ